MANKVTKRLLQEAHKGARRTVPDARQLVTVKKIQDLLPTKTNVAVTEEIVALINNMETDTGLPQNLMEEDVMSYMHLLSGVKGIGMKDLINAIKYCNLKKNMANEKAWEIVFPERYNKLIRENRWNTSHVSMYNGSPLVVKIDTQMMTAVHIQYAPLFHKELMRQVNLADGVSSNGMPVSANIQQVASAKVLDITMQPIEQKIDLKIGQSDGAKEAQQMMFNEMKSIAERQKALLAAGHKIEDVQKLDMKIEVVDDDDFIDIDEEE